MEFSDIHKYYYQHKTIHNIQPTFTINFPDNIFKASCKYDNIEFNVMLSNNDIKHIDADYLYMEVATLLIKKINKEIDNYILYFKTQKKFTLKNI